MNQRYSQLRAMMAITRASLKATFRSPQAIFFSLFFPIVLIWIFGSLGRGGIPKYDVALEKNADTSTAFYQVMKHNPSINIQNENGKDIEDELKKGRITAVIDIQKNHDSAGAPFKIHLRTSSAAQQNFYQLENALSSSIDSMDKTYYPRQETVASVQYSIEPGRKYGYIDFFLPGMIGF